MMNNKTVKRIICMLLCAVMALGAPISAMAVELNSVPVIYVGEIADNALYTDANKNGATIAFDMNSSDFTGDMTNIVAGLLLTSFEGVASGKDSVITGITGMMEPILCKDDGTSADESVGPWIYSEPLSAYSEDGIYTENLKSFARAAAGYISEDEIFFFSYDWRLDPVASGNELKEFIDHVKVLTGKSKVALLSKGYGGIVVNCYLYANGEHAAASITSALFYNTSILGNAIIGDFMKGKVARTNEENNNIFDTIKEIDGTTRGEAFFSYVKEDSTGFIDGIFKNLLGDSGITSLFGKLLTLLVTMILEGQDVHKTLGKSYNNLALGADKEIYNNYLKGYLRNMPGLWAMVPEKDFEAAWSFLFDDEIVNSSLASKIYKYREVQSNTAATLTNAKLSGINVCIVSNYGYQLLPVTISLFDMSDSIESVKYSSAGAVTTDNSTEEGHLVNCINTKHSHKNTEGTIDATYCILPESTWFIKGVTHGDMTIEPVATFLVWLLFGFSQRNVRESASYPQFMEYSTYSKKLVGNAAADEGEQGSRFGDIDYSGDINAADARLALRISVGLEVVNKETKIVADVDGNGSVTAADARLILRYSVGLEQSFPMK